MGRDGKNMGNGNDVGGPGHASQPNHDSERLLPPRGDYQTLLSFRKAEVVYDITFRFAHK